MSRREEGPLGDPKNQGRVQQIDRYVLRRNEEDLQTLADMPQFKRWVGRLLQRCGLTDDLATTNGGDVQRFLGRRSIAVEVLNEVEPVSSGFYLQVMIERQDLLNQAARLEHNLKGNTDE